MTYIPKHTITFKRSPDILADRLIQTLGYSGAKRACRENHWAGAEIYVRRYASDRN
jgi:hypothetical protein